MSKTSTQVGVDVLDNRVRSFIQIPPLVNEQVTLVEPVASLDKVGRDYSLLSYDTVKPRWKSFEVNGVEIEVK